MYFYTNSVVRVSESANLVPTAPGPVVLKGLGELLLKRPATTPKRVHAPKQKKGGHERRAALMRERWAGGVVSSRNNTTTNNKYHQQQQQQ